MNCCQHTLRRALRNLRLSCLRSPLDPKGSQNHSSQPDYPFPLGKSSGLCLTSTFFLVSVVFAILLITETMLAEDVLAGGISNVSVDSTGEHGNQNSWAPQLSGDGRFVAFISEADNLVANDTNGQMDVFVHDRLSGVTERVSIDSLGNEGNDGSVSPAISQNGQIVAFVSLASNLVPNDTNGVSDVFVHDRTTGETTRVNVSNEGEEANGESFLAGWDVSISADGRFVAFHSGATNLVPNDTNQYSDIFLHDRQTGITTRVSVDSQGEEANFDSLAPAISGNGNVITFRSLADNLVEGDSNNTEDVFVHDRVSGITTRASVSSTGEEAIGEFLPIFEPPAISADGRYVVFHSPWINLVPGVAESGRVYLHDRQTGTTELVSRNSQGQESNGFDQVPAISADGRFVTFSSSGTNLVSFPVSGFTNVYLRDRDTGQTSLVNFNDQGVPGTGSISPAFGMAISANGQMVAFESEASDLVSPDTNNVFDIFVSERDGSVNPTRSLSVSFEGNGNGTITSNPSGNQCEADCSEDYLSGTVVVLTAEAASGSEFIGWSGGGCTGTATCTVTLTQSLTITAAFSASTSGPPTLMSPDPGLVLPGSTVTFTWDANGTAVTRWWVYVGSNLGDHDLHDSGNLGTDLSTTVSALPTDGRALFVRLWFYVDGNWESADFQYTAATIVATPPALISPAPGSTLDSATVTLNWTPNGTAVTRWWVYVGSNLGDHDLHDSGNLGTDLSTTVSTLPTDGRALFVRLWFYVDGNWESADFQYTAATIVATPPALTSPAPGSTLDSATVTLNWTPNGTAVTRWWVYVGSNLGDHDLHDSGNLGTDLSTTVSALPTDGRALFVRLWFYVDGNWESADFQYTAATIVATPPALTSPAPGSTLDSATVTLNWTPNGTAVTRWWVYVGSNLGDHDLHDSGNLGTDLSTTVSALPTDGRALFVRLWFYVDGNWEFADFQYTAASQ